MYSYGKRYGELGHSVGVAVGGHHYLGTFLLVVDFCVSGIPVRLLHFVQPLGFSLLYNLTLFIFTCASHRRGPFYRVADYFSHDSNVR